VTVAETRVATIEGRRTLIVERRPPLQPRLSELLSHLIETKRVDVVPRGARIECSDAVRDHRFELFREGRHVGTDNVTRDLRLFMCADCGAVQVRDVSLDQLAGLSAGRGGPRRRDQVIGWYSGARPRQREYR